MSAQVVVAPTSVRSGVDHWLRCLRLMTTWELSSLRLMMPLIVALQVMLGVGFVLGIGLLFDEIPLRSALFLSTGSAVVTMITVGLVVAPQFVANRKTAGTYDFMWSLPVPRSAQAVAWVAVNAVIAIPAMVVSLALADWHYQLPLHVSPSIVPAVTLTIVTATMIGYAFAHAIRAPMVTQLITQLLIWVILGFAPINIPPENLPAWLADLHEYLPFHHMAVVVRAGLTRSVFADVGVSYAVLSLYTAGSVALSTWVIGRRD